MDGNYVSEIILQRLLKPSPFVAATLTFLPDTLALISFALQLSRPPRDMVDAIAQDCRNTFGIPEMQFQVLRHFTDTWTARLTVDRLAKAVRSSSLVALSGALTLAIDPEFQSSGVVLGVLWIVIFAFTGESHGWQLPDINQTRRKRRQLILTFSGYLAISVLLKLHLTL